MNVPQLRFSGFDADIREVKLKEIATVLSGKRLPKGHSFKPSGIPYISVSDMGEVKVKKENFSFISPETEELIKKYKVSSGDIIISIAGTLGKVNLIDGSLENANLTENCNKITVKESEDNKFVFYYLKSEIIQKKIQESSTTSSQPKLALDRLRNFEIRLPSSEEQQKISSFFERLSQKIEKQQEKIGKLEQLNKGMMQKIFSQELRFKDEDGREFPEWEEKKLGDLCNITTGKLDANAMQSDGQYRFYTCAKEYYWIDKYAFDTEALLVSGNGANVGYIHYYKGKFNAYQRTYILDAFEENIIYLKFYLERFLSLRIMAEKNVGNTPYIVLGTLYDMPILIPDIREQAKIATFLSELDTKLKLEKDKLLVLEEQKRGFMQGMFV